MGLEEAVQGAQLVHEDVPGNVGAHLVQEVPSADGRGAVAVPRRAFIS